MSITIDKFFECKPLVDAIVETKGTMAFAHKLREILIDIPDSATNPSISINACSSQYSFPTTNRFLLDVLSDIQVSLVDKLKSLETQLAQL